MKDTTIRTDLAHPADIQRYLHRIQHDAPRRFACNCHDGDELLGWQAEARPALQELIGLGRIAEAAPGHQPSVRLGKGEAFDGYRRWRGAIETEPDVSLPFWLLRPEGPGPFPLAMTPHGHDVTGFDTSVGIAGLSVPDDRLRAEDRDVAVQAVKAGFVAVAPATRGIAVGGVTDVDGRFAKNCRAHALHALLAGRTSIGERVWDMMRLLDWALAREEVRPGNTLMLGNSGGGVVTFFAAACDTRITIAIPSCAFNTFVTDDGRMHHCDCNTVPGILRFGEAWDVAGLIAPRHLLIVNGRCDEGRSGSTVDRAAAEVRRIYEAAGVGNRFELRYGPAGHRFYKDIMWPFVRRAMS